MEVYMDILQFPKKLKMQKKGVTVLVSESKPAEQLVSCIVAMLYNNIRGWCLKGCWIPSYILKKVGSILFLGL